MQHTRNFDYSELFVKSIPKSQFKRIIFNKLKNVAKEKYAR